MLFVFLFVSFGIIVAVSLAFEWLLDWLFLHSNGKTGADRAGSQLSQAEMRAYQRAEFHEICDDMVWNQMVVARGWLVSGTLAKRTFQLLANDARRRR